MSRFLKNTIPIAGLAAIVFAAGVTASQAAVRYCGERAALVRALKDKYQEVPVAMGLSQRSTEALEIFTSETGSWTVVMTMTDGRTCIMAAGHSWHDVPRVKLGVAS